MHNAIRKMAAAMWLATITVATGCVVQALSSDSSAELSARRGDTSAGKAHQQVPAETTGAAAAIQAAGGTVLGPGSTENVGAHRRI